MYELAPKVLCISSHVVHGYTGNRVAVFPLQFLGFDVSYVNTAQFSNPSRYCVSNGENLTVPQLVELANTLKTNKLANFDFVQTGYAASPLLLREIKNIINDIRASNPNLLYVCNPEIEIKGEIQEELVDAYKKEIFPWADVITFDQFGIEGLTGRKIQTEHDVVTSMEECHSFGPSIVFLSRCQTKNTEHLTAYVSCSKINKLFKVSFPGTSTRVFDIEGLFSALTVAYIFKHGKNFAAVLESVVSICQDIVELTLQYHDNKQNSLIYCSDSNSDSYKRNDLADQQVGLELRLIEGRHLLNTNTARFKSEPVSF